jgi:hypothetical protein
VLPGIVGWCAWERIGELRGSAGMRGSMQVLEVPTVQQESGRRGYPQGDFAAEPRPDGGSDLTST